MWPMYLGPCTQLGRPGRNAWLLASDWSSPATAATWEMRASRWKTMSFSFSLELCLSNEYIHFYNKKSWTKRNEHYHLDAESSINKTTQRIFSLLKCFQSLFKLDRLQMFCCFVLFNTFLKISRRAGIMAQKAWLSHHLQHWHPISELQFQSWLFSFWSISLLMWLGK